MIGGLMGSKKNGIRISNTSTGHGTLLGFDHIREFTTDPVRRQRYGTLILKAQVHIGGNYLWTAPIGPGGPVPDGFENVRGWKRENDAAYIQSRFRTTRPPPVMPQPSTRNSGLPQLALVVLLVGVGVAIAEA